LYKHIAGPRKGGLYVDYDQRFYPYYSQRERRKNPDEIHPKQIMTQDQALSMLVMRSQRDFPNVREATYLR